MCPRGSFASGRRWWPGRRTEWRRRFETWRWSIWNAAPRRQRGSWSAATLPKGQLCWSTPHRRSPPGCSLLSRRASPPIVSPDSPPKRRPKHCASCLRHRRRRCFAADRAPPGKPYSPPCPRTSRRRSAIAWPIPGIPRAPWLPGTSPPSSKTSRWSALSPFWVSTGRPSPIAWSCWTVPAAFSEFSGRPRWPGRRPTRPSARSRGTSFPSFVPPRRPRS